MVPPVCYLTEQKRPVYSYGVQGSYLREGDPDGSPVKNVFWERRGEIAVTSFSVSIVAEKRGAVNGYLGCRFTVCRGGTAKVDS